MRSVQLYGTDPAYVGKATEILCAEYGVAHVDLNFGCPVPKVTRKGGGAALPWKRTLLGEILEAAVAAAVALRRAGDDEDAQGHRRGPPDLPRRGPDRRRSPGSPRSRCTDVRRSRATPAPPTGTRSPAWSSTSTSRCWATATSGRPPTPSGWSSRPAPTAWSSAAAASAGRGCSATWPHAFADPRAVTPTRVGARPPPPRRGGRDDAPARRAAEHAHGGGARLQGVPQARVVVPQGLPRRRRPAPRPGPGRAPSRSWTPCSPSSTRTRRSRSPSWAPRGAARAAPARASRCRRGGWTTPTAPGASYARRRRRPPAAEASGRAAEALVNTFTWRASRTGCDAARLGRSRLSVVAGRRSLLAPDVRNPPCPEAIPEASTALAHRPTPRSPTRPRGWRRVATALAVGVGVADQRLRPLPRTPAPRPAT